MSRAGRAAAIIAAILLYLTGLSSAGLIGPDEPRYASIGREMAQSGDWITPRLWGEAWFEKPPLEYWGIAAAYCIGLGDDLAPRAFNAVVGLSFLAFFWFALSRILSRETATIATAILATTVGWMAESRIAVMDLPLAAAFSAAMLAALAGWFPAAGVFFGLAILAKGLVPIVLVLPALVLLRHRWRQLLVAATLAFAVAAPWYVAMLARHGRMFFDEFIVRHHFSRFTDASLQHTQPFWFFVPILLAALFPWTPLAFGIRLRKQPQAIFLAVWVLFGFVFFSVSRNKLPGYALPLLPPLAVLCALELRESRRAWAWCAACGLLLGLTPIAAQVLPDALASGLSRASIAPQLGFAVLIVVGAAGVGAWRAHWGVAASAALCLGLLWLRIAPELDVRATARPTWNAIAGKREQACVDSLHRAWRYGLNFYSVTPIPDCEDSPRPVRIRQRASEPPEIQLELQTESPVPIATRDRGVF